MFAKTTNVGFAQRVVATLVASAVVMTSYGFYNIAQAANFTLISDTLSDSDLNVGSDHLIKFTVPTGSSITTGETLTITFPAAFTTMNTVVSGDVTTTVAGSAVTPTFGQTGQTITLTNFAAAATEEVIVAITNERITNPNSAGSYEISVSDGTDTGKTRVAIIDNVLVTAIVETTFDFVISGLATSSAVNGDSTTGSTTATAIPFGVLAAGVPKILAQQLNVQTNARNGFSVTVETDGDLQSSTGAIIDTFLEGTDIAVSGTAWTTPSNDINDETTWGHWGMTSDDTDLANDLDTADSYIAASTTPREVFSHEGPSDGAEQDIGKAIVGYQVEITALQEAGDDYNTTLTYIATPTF
jgi:hypothetical protein